MAIIVNVNSNSQVDTATRIIIEKIKQNIIATLQSESFYNYIGNILENQFYLIAGRELSTFESGEDFEKSRYLNGLHLEIKNNVVTIYNDATVDLDKKDISPEKRVKYTELSLAKIVEYGIGYVGRDTLETTQSEDNWIYDMNNYEEKGWHYKGEDGQGHWTKGFEGRLIFYKMLTYLRENMDTIIADYLKVSQIER